MSTTASRTVTIKVTSHSHDNAEALLNYVIQMVAATPLPNEDDYVRVTTVEVVE